MIPLMKQVDIVALGEPLIEMVRSPEQKNGKPVYQQGVGGDALNALVAAARQGGSVGLISAVGNDPFGQEIVSFCKTEGIDTTGVQVRAHDPTGVCFIDPDPKHRSFTYARRGSAASHFAPDDLPKDKIAAAKILHITAVSQAISPTMCAAVDLAARIARSNGTLVSYDLNLRLNLWSIEEARRSIEAFLPLADIVLPSDDEAALICGTEDQSAIFDYFNRHSPRIVALKKGRDGVTLSYGGAIEQVPAPRVIARDSAGAGDSFAGSFLLGLARSTDVRAAAAFACSVAAQTVTGLGAVDAIPYRSS